MTYQGRELDRIRTITFTYYTVSECIIDASKEFRNALNEMPACGTTHPSVIA